MVSKTKQAIEATRDNCGVVSFKDSGDRIYVSFRESVPLAAEDLIRDEGWLIRPSSAREKGVKLYQ